MNRIDHTNLKPTVTASGIKQLCLEAQIYGFRGVCVPPNKVSLAAQSISDDYIISTVIGFPFGYNTCKTKLFESERAIIEQVDELDVVWSLGQFLEGKYASVLKELAEIVNYNLDTKVKVIVEESYIPEDKLLDALQIVYDSGAYAIKTSTGYAKPARLSTVQLWKEQNKDLKIKAAGGISSLEIFNQFVSAGADIIGTSHGVSIVQEQGLLQ